MHRLHTEPRDLLTNMQSAGVITALSRFRLRQLTIESFYALLRSAGLSGLRGQAVWLAIFISLGNIVGQ